MEQFQRVGILVLIVAMYTGVISKILGVFVPLAINLVFIGTGISFG